MNNSRIEVLISTLNSNPRQLVKKMGVRSDATIINQCNESKYEKFTYNNHTIHVWHTKDRGIGKSRKMALEKSSGDILLFADDDEELEKNYCKTLLSSFNQNKNYDMLIFNINNKEVKFKNFKKIRWFNCLHYGATRVAVKRSSIQEKGISFDEEFGASKYGHGEDSIFIHDCIKKHLKILASQKTIATLRNDRPSTWATGHNEKYFYDTGALFARLYGVKALPIILFNLIRKKHFDCFSKNVLTSIRGWKNYLKDKDYIKNKLIQINPLYVAIILFLCYSPLFTKIFPYPFILSVTRIAIFICAFILAILQFKFRKDKFNLKFLIGIISYLIFMVICWGVNETFSFSRTTLEYYFLPITLASIFLLLFNSRTISNKNLKIFLAFIVIFNIISCIFNIVDNIELFPKLITMQGGYSVQFSSYYSNRNSFALLIFFGIFSNLLLLLDVKNKKNIKWLFLSLTFLTINLLITFSRTTIIMTAIIMLTWIIILLRDKKNQLHRFALYASIFSPIIIVILLLIPPINSYIFSNIIRISAGTTHRNKILSYTTNYFMTHNRLIGSGYIKPLQDFSQYFSNKGFHNSYITILLSTGIVGFTYYIALLIYTTKNNIKNLRRNKTPILFLAITIAYLFYSFFESKILFETSDLGFLFTVFLILIPLYQNNALSYQYQQNKISRFATPKNIGDEQQTLVSIIIPTYNRSNTIERAIRSAINQTYKNIEIIVVDDNAAKQEERKKTKHIIDKYKNVKLIQNETNLGGGGTRNIGIQKASGSLIAFLDDDDEFLPTKISKQVQLYNTVSKNHQVGVIYSYEYSILIRRKRIVKKDHEGNVLFEHMCNFTMPTSTWLCSKSVLESVGGFDNVKSQQDLLLLMKILARGYEIYRVPEPLINFYVHAPGQGISEHSEAFIDQVIYYMNQCRKEFWQLSENQQKEVEFNFNYRLFNSYLDIHNKKKAKNYLAKMIKYKPISKQSIKAIIKFNIK